MIARASAGAVVTAAGASRRMGSPKALLDWGGRPLLAHQLAVLEGLGRTVAVLGAGAPQIAEAVPLPPNARRVVHEGWAAGRAGSIRAGLAAFDAPPEALVIAGVDQPLEPDTLERLLQAASAERIVVPVHGGRRGHPAVFGRAFWEELQRLDEATQGLRRLLLGFPEAVREVPVPSPAVLWDLNDPASYREALKRAPEPLLG